MKHLKKSSDYDEILLDKIRDSKLLLIDLDGTLINFEEIDHKIIEKVFFDKKRHRFIRLIDKFLWWINRQDIIGNGYASLKLRLWAYSIMCGYAYGMCKAEYKELYQYWAEKALDKVLVEDLSYLIDEGYKIKIATKNVYAINLLNNIKSNTYSKEVLDLIVLEENKKQTIKNWVKLYENKVCIIGNNFWDDILNAYRTKSTYVYIGFSKFVENVCGFFDSTKSKKRVPRKTGIQVESFEEIRKILMKEGDDK